MAGVLVLAEADAGGLHATSFELIAAGLELAKSSCDPLRVLIVDPDPSRHGAALSVPGVEEVLTITSPVEHFEPHLAGAAVRALIEAERPHVVLAADSAEVIAYAPAVAAELGLGFVSGATAVAWEDGGPVVTRPVHGDRLVAELDFPGKRTVLVTVRSGAYAPVASGGGSAVVREPVLALDASLSATTHLGYSQDTGGELELGRAPFVVAIGRGVEDAPGVAELEGIARTLGAAFSVSGGLLDGGLGSAARKVGVSGKTIEPKVYLALGISGAPQHVSGVRKAGTIIAVNTDPEAPIFGAAHYGAVADLFEVARALPRYFSWPSDS
ncbi:MAG TPA: electron transfer flavoprotein subunit alpha/FixB family protein [Solirubrobacteraceae bacterium]|nr:electron transfer flavoprotein subunit alpha/FixB family protein [Solirubrobacteraceae bacterium]